MTTRAIVPRTPWHVIISGPPRPRAAARIVGYEPQVRRGGRGLEAGSSRNRPRPEPRIRLPRRRPHVGSGRRLGAARGSRLDGREPRRPPRIPAPGRRRGRASPAGTRRRAAAAARRPLIPSRTGPPPQVIRSRVCACRAARLDYTRPGLGRQYAFPRRGDGDFDAEILTRCAVAGLDSSAIGLHDVDERPSLIRPRRGVVPGGGRERPGRPSWPGASALAVIVQRRHRQSHGSRSMHSG